jgi:DNA repair protein SbcC/Rad50
LRDLAAKVHTMEVQRTHAATDGKTCKALLDQLTARAEFVAVVPCHGEGPYAECPALKEAMDASGQIPGMQVAVDTRRAEWKAIGDQIKALEDQVLGINDARSAHDLAVSILNNLRNMLAAQQRTAAQRSALVLAEQHMAEAQAAVDDLTKRLALAHVDASVRLTELDGEIAEAAAARDEVSATVSATVSAIEDELAGIPEPGTDQAVTMARQRLADAEAAVQAAQSSIDQASATKAQHEAEIVRLRAELAENAAVVAKARRLEAEIADWTLLGMGLRGVIDLSIEDAGPSIAAIANDLLNTAYGPRFSVRIVTQREQANGKTVETFDISVIDSDSGMEASILQKSGGEAVILDRCLTDAAAIFQQDQIGRRYETAFADEADGALSGENRRMFYQMERRAMEIGQYGRKYFVSHRPESWDDADFVLDLAQYREAA